MKIKIIFSILIILLFPIFQSFAADSEKQKGKNNGNKINYSGSPREIYMPQTCFYDNEPYECGYSVPDPYYTTKYCPAGEVLIETQRNKNPLAVAGQLSCMVIDDNYPIISASLNGYVNNSWTNKNVKLNFNVSDVGLGIKSVKYIVNGVNYLGSTNFELDFSDEGIYEIAIVAEDKSTHDGLDGSVTDQGNIKSEAYTVKIDKSGLVLTDVPDTNYNNNWRNVKPTLTFNIVDKYKGQSIEVKTFTCTSKPDNSYWTGRISPSGELVGVCDPGESDCTTDSNFTPNLVNCNWSCLAGYTKGSDNLCYENTKTLTCDNSLLPQGLYGYDKDDALTYLSGSLKSIWSSPLGVSIDGDFLTSYNGTTNSYSPDASSCGYTCSAGLHVEDSKCVNNNSIICCQKSYPLSQPKSIGVVVDCSIVANQNHISCQYNDLCLGYVKDVLKYRTETGYLFESEGVKSIGTLSEACGMENIPNSNGQTCNPGYYLVGEGTATQSCERVPTGEYSEQENVKKACTNAPNNANYIAHTDSPFTGNADNCPWVCDGDSTKNGNRCDRQSKTSSCDAKPSNTSWNSVSTITQYKNGGNWEPSLTPLYSMSGSTEECRFKCSTGYGWDGNSCELIVNGSCGSANGGSFASTPSINLCSSGTAISVSGTGPWTWSCNGSNGGNNVSCSANILLNGCSTKGSNVWLSYEGATQVQNNSENIKITNCNNGSFCNISHNISGNTWIKVGELFIQNRSLGYIEFFARKGAWIADCNFQMETYSRCVGSPGGTPCGSEYNPSSAPGSGNTSNKIVQ